MSMTSSLSKSTSKLRHESNRETTTPNKVESHDRSLMKRKLVIGVQPNTAIYDEIERLYAPSFKTLIGNQQVKFARPNDDKAKGFDGILTDDESDAKGFDWGGFGRGIGNAVVQNLPSIASAIGGIISSAQGKGLDSQSFIAAIDEDVSLKRDLRNQSDQFDDVSLKPRFYSLRDINSQQVKPDVVVVSKQFAQSNPVFAPICPMPGLIDHITTLVKSINAKCLVSNDNLLNNRTLRIAIPSHDPLWSDVLPFRASVMGQKGLELRHKTMLQGHKVEYVYDNEPHDVLMTNDATYKAPKGDENVVVAKEGAVEATLGLLDGTKEQQNGKNFDWLGLASTLAGVAGTVIQGLQKK